MKKNLLALLLGIFLTVIFFGAAEIFFRWNQSAHWLTKQTPHLPEVSIHRDLSLSLFEELKDSPAYAWKPLLSKEEGQTVEEEGPDAHLRGDVPCCVESWTPHSGDFHSVVKSKDQKLVFDAHFTLDKLGRRITIENPKAHYNILMFGDSYTLGEGIDNEESAPYILAEMRPDAQVYNLALAANGPTGFLYELEKKPERLSDIKRQKSIVLYSFINHHMERLICRSPCMKERFDWVSSLPYYARVDGEIKYQGFFKTDRPIRNTIYKAISASALLDFFNVVWPPRFSEKDYELFADVMLAAQKRAQELLGDVEFYLVIYPKDSGNYGPALKAVAEKKGIKVLDYSAIDADLATGGKGGIPGDDHPSPATAYLFAHLLNRDLPKF